MHSFKFPSIKEEYDGRTIVDPNLFIYEKMDGGNVSIRKDGTRIVPWSRGGPLGRSEKYYFNAFRQSVFELLAPEIYKLPENLIPFGEFPHPGYGHIPYDTPYLNKFFLIGVYDTDAQVFLRPADSQQRLADIDVLRKIKVAPLLRRGSINQKKADELVQHSGLYSGPREGIVLHHYDPAHPHGVKMSKYYHPDFRERDYNKEGIEQFTTLRRFIKAGQGLLAAGEEITLEGVLEAATRDIMGEMGSSSATQISRIIELKRSLITERVLPLFQQRV